MSLIAAIEPGTVRVEPGGSAEAKVRVKNQSERVDGFRIEVVGPMAKWATVEPPVLNLYARAEGEATITFRPPRAPVPRARSHRFGVKVQSVAEPDTSTVEEAFVTVLPFIALTTALTKRVARGWRSAGHEVKVTNGGNDVARVTATAADPEEEVNPTVEPSRVDIEPGGTATLLTSVIRPSLYWRGAARRRPYTIHVSESTGGSETISAIFEQRPIVPGWASLIAGLVAALLVVVAIGPRVIDWWNDATATAAPSGSTQTLGPSPSPSVEPSPSPTPEPTPSPTPEPTATPTLEPTPTPTLPPTPPPTPLVAPSPELNFPYYRLTNYNPDGRYVAETQKLTISGDTIVIKLLAKVDNYCEVELHMPATSGVDKYVMGGQITGSFRCLDDISAAVNQGGELIVTKIGSQWSGWFKFHAKSGFRELDVEGWFINAAP
jgi:antitoxin (DNA-binding transcriptional repressor) of toxin-antitoxin stability system